MDQKISRTRTVKNELKFMWADSLHSLQPSGTYREAWNAVDKSENEENFGLKNEMSNELKVSLPGRVIGLIRVEERDQFVTFTQVGEGTEIGIIDKKTHTYKSVVTTGKVDKFINATYQIDSCNDLRAYWSENNMYKTANLDESCENHEIEDLIKCDSIAPIRVSKQEGGRLPNGAYWFTLRLKDDDGNYTNTVKATDVKFAAGGNYREGEQSENKFVLNFDIASTEYTLADIIVISKVNGFISSRIVETIGVSVGPNSYEYARVSPDDEVEIQIEEVFSRNNRYILGHNLVQFDNRLILYNIIPRYNLDYQRQALDIELKYIKTVVPIDLAEDQKGLRDNEKYQFGIAWNYCDDTSSDIFLLAGEEANRTPVSDNCKDCEQPYFKVNDTSQRTSLFISGLEGDKGQGYGTTVDDTQKSERASNCKVAVDEDFPLEEVSERSSGDPESPEIDPDPIFQTFWNICNDDPESCPDKALFDQARLYSLKDDAEDKFDEIKDEIVTTYGQENLIPTGKDCTEDGAVNCVGEVCYECVDGKWKYRNNSDTYTPQVATTRGGGSSELGGAGGGGGGLEESLNPTPIYAEDGCTIIDYKFKKYSEGKFGAYETLSVYPNTINSDCEFIYGELRGKNVRLSVAPSTASEPNFVSLTHGVPTKADPGNNPDTKSYAIMTGLSVSNIKFPENPPKPLNEERPYSIYYVERTPNNTSVVASAFAVSTFKGKIGDTEYLFGKNGLNGPEFFDKHINPSGSNTFRGGYTNTDKPVYLLYSPDLSMYKPALDVDFCIFEQELSGFGNRYGLYAEGERSKNLFRESFHQKGTRGSIFLSEANGLPQAKYRCVNNAGYIKDDSVMEDNTVDTPVCNLLRESSTYIELGDGSHFEPFSVDSYLEYGGGDGSQGVSIFRDGATDDSFIGDTMVHECAILNARAHQVTLVRDLPNQYGSPINQTYLPIGLDGTGSSTEGLVGDSHVDGFSVKRHAWVSDKVPKDITRVRFGALDNIFDFLTSFQTKWVLFEARDVKVFNTTLFTVPEISIDLTAFFTRLITLIKFIFSSFFRIIGYDNCGDVPRSGDRFDQRNYAGGLRGNPTGWKPALFDAYVAPFNYDGNPWNNFNASKPVPARRGNKEIPDDAYYPGLIKYNIYTYLGANINPKYRQLGEQSIGVPAAEIDGIAEVNSRNLGIFNLDSVFTGKNWPKAYLNRFFLLVKQPPRILIIGRVIAHILFTFGVGLFFVIRSLFGIIEAASSLYIDAVVVGSNIYGILIGIIMYMLTLYIGIIWILFWTSTDLDSKLIDELLNIDGCKPDIKFNDNSYGVDETSLRQYETNYYRYNLDYSSTNRFEPLLGLPDPYKTEEIKEFDNTFYYSEPQVQGSSVDSWRNFKVNNYLRIPMHHGKITNMFQLGDRLFAHTTDNIIRIAQGSDSLTLQGGTEIYLGSGTLFGDPKPIFGGIQEGFAGCKDPNAAFVTSRGYIFFDRDAGDIYSFSPGAGIKSFGSKGMARFLKNNMPFELLKSFPEFTNIDTKAAGSIGYSLGVDPYLDRFLFTKIDYKLTNTGCKFEDGVFTLNGKEVALGDPSCFENRSFTISFNQEKEWWVSFHNYTPMLYTWDRYNMYSFNDEGLWLHNSKNGFQEFYGIKYPFSVEYVINDNQENNTFKYISTILDTEMYTKFGDGQLQNVDETFNKIIAFNSHQSSGELDLVKSNDLDVADTSTEDDTRVLAKFKNRYWTFKSINDRLIDNTKRMFLINGGIGPKIVNTDNISEDNKKNILTDNYLSGRLIFDIFDKEKEKSLYIKNIQTEIETQSK